MDIILFVAFCLFMLAAIDLLAYQRAQIRADREKTERVNRRHDSMIAALRCGRQSQ